MSHSPVAPCCPVESLTLYHFGELDATELQAVASHLQACAACRRELEQLRRVLAMLPDKERELAPADLRDFNARVIQHLGPRRWRPSRPALGWSLAAATAMLLLLTLHFPFPGTRSPETGGGRQIGALPPGMPAPDLLLNLELLEKLDLLQELEGPGIHG